MRFVLTLFLVLSLFFPAASALASFFDVSLDHPNATAIAALQEQGILSGDDVTGLFAPGRTLNRAEFAKIIVEANGWDITEAPYHPVFPDVPEGPWYTPYILTANARGVLLGTGAGRAEPGRQVLMIEALTMSLRAFAVAVPPTRSNDPWYANYLRAGTEQGFLTAVQTSFNQPLPRGEAAQLIWNGMEREKMRAGTSFDVLVCMIRWRESDPLVSVAELAKVMSEVNTFFDETSYGAVRLQTRYAGNTVYRGAPTDYVTDEINAAVSVCDPFVDFSTIDRMIIYPSKATDLSFNMAGDTASQEGTFRLNISFIRDFLLGTIAHELGHGFGALHVHGLECGDAAARREGCTIASYGSPYDVTGEPTFAGHFHGWNKTERLHWGNQQTVTESGTYLLSALEVSSTLPHVLRIPYGEDGGVCLEYRKPIGFDDFASRNIRDRIAHLVRFPADGAILLVSCPDLGLGTMAMIDTTPNSQTSEYLADFADGYLTADRTFSDDTLGLTISFTPLPDHRAEVSVEKRPGGFVPVLPEVIDF